MDGWRYNGYVRLKNVIEMDICRKLVQLERIDILYPTLSTALDSGYTQNIQYSYTAVIMHKKYISVMGFIISNV